MANYKFHINKGKISDEKVKKHKDFKKLLYNYQRATRPITRVKLYQVRNKRIFMSLLMIFLILFILFSEAIFEETGLRPENPAKYDHSIKTVIHQTDNNNLR